MNKQTYLAKLARLLAPLPEQERQDALNYYPNLSFTYS